MYAVLLEMESLPHILGKERLNFYGKNKPARMQA